MTTIHLNSEAGRELARIVANDQTYKVSIDDRSYPDNPLIALKRNEGVWTPPLRNEEDES